MEKDQFPQVVDSGKKGWYKPTFNKAMVALVVCLNVPFAAAVLFIFYRIGKEPETLIKYWSTGMISELLAMAALKWREIGTKGKNPDVDY